MRISARHGKFIVLGLVVLAAVTLVALQVRAQQTRVIQLNQADSYLGIEMDEVTADNFATYKLTAERGVIVRSVEKGSPAEAANLQEKDVILEYAGSTVHSAKQLARLVEETPAGRKVDLVVSRDGKRMNLSAKIGKREGPWSFGSGRFDFRRQGGPGEFRFQGPQGRMFQFGVPEGKEGPFSFKFPESGDFGFFMKRPRLGVTLENLTDQMADYLGVPGKKGVLVTSVADGTPAAAARLKAGDVIVRANNKEIDSPDDIARIVGDEDSGQRLELKVIREKKEMTLVVELPSEEKKTGGYKV
jgi:S1-C subfamily serine protease